MNRKYAWVQPVVTLAILLGCWLYAFLTTPGLQQDPAIAFVVLASLVVVPAPFLWLEYRRMRRYPLVVEVAPDAAEPIDARLERPPLILVASRFKVLIWCVAMVAWLCLFGGLALAQRGVCRVVSPRRAWRRTNCSASAGVITGPISGALSPSRRWTRSCTPVLAYGSA
jgi:hypothetical protein